MSSKPDYTAAPSEATFSLVSCICHFDTSTSGTIDTTQDVSVAFHSRLELCNTLNQQLNVISNNINHLGTLRHLIDLEIAKQDNLFGKLHQQL